MAHKAKSEALNRKKAEHDSDNTCKHCGKSEHHATHKDKEHPKHHKHVAKEAKEEKESYKKEEKEHE